MPVTVSANDARVKVTRQEPITDAGANSVFDLSKIPVLSGGKAGPYQLSKDKSLWSKWVDNFGSAFDQSDVDTFNTVSKRMARKYGVDSVEYQEWARSILESWYGPGGTTPKEIEEEGRQSALTSFLGAIVDVQTYVRIGEGILGIAALAFGIVLLSKELGVSVPVPAKQIVSAVRGGTNG